MQRGGYMAKRPNGTGSIIKLKQHDKETGELRESKFWYILYTVDGRQRRESTGTEDYEEAKEQLKLALAENALGMRPTVDVKAVTYEDVAAIYTDQQQAKGAAPRCEKMHLDEFFNGKRALDITTDLLRRYISHRSKAGVAGPTIRRELGTLRAMLNQARKEGKLRLADIPYFPMPEDSKPRKGFVTPDVFATLLAALPENLRPLVQFIYCTGMRRGAALKITWDMLNEDCTELSIPGDILKNDEALALPLAGADLGKLAAMLKKQFRVQGQPVFASTNLRKEWAEACTKLGLGKMQKKKTDAGWSYASYRGLMLHDLRRSAVRNLVRAGVPESVAMKISAHKTRHVFERYNIVDTRDVREALIKQGEYARVQRRGKLEQMPKPLLKGRR
jgi:integrase